MLATTWMWTHEWSLIRIRRAALTFATCHQARSEMSALARDTISRRIRLRRAGRLIRIAATASSGVIAAPRSASTETPRGPVGGGSRCSSSAMAHTVQHGAHPAPDVAGALPAAQVLVAEAA